jgi:hypothetical protein
VENGADMPQIKTSRCKIYRYVKLQTAIKYATKSAMHDQILCLKTHSLKSYCFPHQITSNTFIIHSFIHSPFINGCDSLAMICEIGKLAGTAATFDLVRAVNIFCCHCSSRLRFFNDSYLQKH